MIEFDFENFSIYARLAAASSLVLITIWSISIIIRRLSWKASDRLWRNKRQLRIIETLPIDTKHRLILIEYKTTQHLLLISPSGNKVIESSKMTNKSKADNHNEQDANPYYSIQDLKM